MYQYLSGRGEAPPTPMSGGPGTIGYSTPAPTGNLPGAVHMPQTVPITHYQGPSPLPAQLGPRSVTPPPLQAIPR